MREKEFPCDDLFVNRWSPRSMTGESITDEELMTLFEASRWAPSSYNEQPWRIIYAKRDTEHWDTLYNLMVEQNQVWAKNAAVLCLIASKENFTYNDKPNKVHSFDAGSAWENLALQATISGLAVHGMAGFDYDKAKTDLNIPDGFKVEAMFAIGKQAPKEDLPEELQKMEEQSDRKKVVEFAFEGSFKEKA